MNFTTFSFFLAGLAATLIPIVIHLLSKGKPKKIVFPALQFAAAKLSTNKRKFTLKKLLLLVVRACLFILLGLILARPYFADRSANKTLVETAEEAALEEAANVEEGEESQVPTKPETAGIAGRDSAVAAIVCVDTSPRMLRVKENATLFDRAIETARTILDQTPKGSDIAILDGSYDGDAFLPDRYAAKQRLEKLLPAATGRTIAQTVLEGIALAERSELGAREIFVITDATRAGWAERDIRKLVNKLTPSAANPTPPTLYFVDLGDEDYRNVSIVDLALSAETISQDATLRVDVDIERDAATAGDVTLELVVFDAKKSPADLSDLKLFNNKDLILHRESQTASFGEGRSKRSVNFQTSGLPLGPCIGAARVVGGDALSVDDVRWFAVDVAPERKLLVVAPAPCAEKALFLTQALAPEDLRRAGKAPFDLDVVPYSAKGSAKNRTETAPRDLATATAAELSRYRAIFLLDPLALDEKVVKRLTAFVEDGGGLGVFLGRNAAPIAPFQSPEVVDLLGCKPTTQVKAPNWDRQLLPVDYNTPLLATFRQFESYGIPWDALPIAKYWKLEDVSETATVVAHITGIGADNTDAPNEALPGLIENRVGRGVVATLATPISDSTQNDPWNALTSTDAAWVFVVFADGAARRLASSSSSILNYTVGEVATLSSPLKTFPGAATIVTPNGEEISTPTDVERRQIRFPGVKAAGVYRARTTANKDGKTIDVAFAASIDPSKFDLTRYPEEEWDRLWDGAPYKKLDLKAAGKTLDAARRGKQKDPYAFLVILLATLFVCETWIANRFYK